MDYTIPPPPLRRSKLGLDLLPELRFAQSFLLSMALKRKQTACIYCIFV